ncbi:hypothetical protein ACQJBY_029677 [Aegilops geniculata]
MATSAADAAAAAATVPSYPAWVLLEKKGYDDELDRADAASATSETFGGRAVKVAFYLVPPPEVSYFCFHLSKLEDDDDDFDFQPLFLFSAKGFVLFRLLFINRSDRSHLVEYFMYKAGGGKPSLEPIPSTPLGSSCDSICLSIVPCPDDEDNYVLADLSVGRDLGHYDLHVYSSKTHQWSTKPLQLPESPAVRTNDDLPCQFNKVLVLGANEFGWVDLWRGIVTCKVLDNDPVLRLIPLPKPEINNPHVIGGDVEFIRDVTYRNGIFKFVEIDNFCIPAIARDETSNIISKTMQDFDSNDIIHDSELIYPVLKQAEPIIVPDGWKIQSYFRFPSRDYWLRTHAVHVDDISEYDPKYCKVSPQWLAFAENSTLRNLKTYCPTFGIHGDSVVYLLAKVKPEDYKTWIVGVDIEKKMLRLIQPYTYAEGGYALPTLLPSTFSYYLNNTTPGLFPSTETNYSENALNNATIHGDASVPDLGYDPLSCAGEATSAPRTLNFEETNQPLSSNECGNIGQTITLQSLHAILTSSGSESGYLHPRMKLSLKTKEDGKIWLSLPLGCHFSKPSGPELKLFNSLIARQSTLPASLKHLGLNNISWRPNIPIFADVLPPVNVLDCGLRNLAQPHR